MSKARHICFDRILPQDLHRQQRVMTMRGGRMRAIAPIGKQWVNGSEITIRFMNGSKQQRDMVKAIAPEWTRHANLEFAFTQSNQAQIRILFDANDGAWSYVGRDNLSIPKNMATMNLGWQDEAVILHEFGHMIGLAHEHQNPDGGIVWNEAAVIADLSGPPNFWDEATIRHNVLDKYRADQLNGTEFDPKSIMLYAFPDDWTQNIGATQENSKLSAIDKAFIKSAKMYPGKAKPTDTAVDLPVYHGLHGSISAQGEEDLYRFTVDKEGMHNIETFGMTDVVLSVYGPDNPTELVGSDDDSGIGSNAQISALLMPGTYYAQVRHYNPKSTGDYRIMVSSF